MDAMDIQEFTTIVANLKQENERLRIENNLLRKASEEQRELNGQLRVELSNHILNPHPHPKG